MVIPRLRLADYLEKDEVFLWLRSRLAPGQRRTPHCHDFYELFWVEHGTCMHTLADPSSGKQRDEVLPTGTLVFIRPDDAHCLRARGGDCFIINIAFPSATVDFLASRYGGVLGGQAFWSVAPDPAKVSLGSADLRSLAAWSVRLERAGRGQLVLDAFLLAVFGLLTSDEPLPLGVEDGPAWLVEVCRSLHRPERARLGVRGFVALSGCAPEHVSRVTRRWTGKTPSDLVREARLRLAAGHLTTTDAAIAEIAAEVGLDNLSHFYRLFKETYGMTPKAYRQQNRRDLVSSV
ncbi:MAG: AraC family transcriptional regulator [Pseudomonadota bacterium]